MNPRRSQRMADLIRDELSVLLLRELKDPRIGMITITQVELSPDLKRARILYSVVGDEERRRESQAGLNSATGFIRSRLGRRLAVRRVPELGFQYDSSLATGSKVTALIEQLNRDAEQ